MLYYAAMGRFMTSLRAAAAVSVFAFFPDAFAERAGDWSCGYYAEVSASSYMFSLGSVRADQAVWYLEGDVVQRLSSYGHVLLGYWALSDIEKPRNKGRRSNLYESDPYVFYGYDWEFAQGWRLCNRIGYSLVCETGYDNARIDTFNEWTYMGEFKSPWLEIFGQTRAVDTLGTYARIGARRNFALSGGALSVMPHIAMHGGSKNWNRRRYGNYVTGRGIGSGLGTVEYGVRFHGPVKWGLGWFVDFCGYDAVDSRTRTQIRERRNRGSTMKLDAFFLYSGLAWEF